MIWVAMPSLPSGELHTTHPRWWRQKKWRPLDRMAIAQESER